MAVKAADLEAELIDTVCARIRERLPDDQIAPCEAFVRQYYHWVPAEDLAGRSPLDLYGAAVAHWNLIQQRGPGEAKVHVYNPEFEHHGWQSPHTVVEIVTDDMPFIVDSVTMELVRQGYGIDLVIHPVIRVRREESGALAQLLEPGAAPGDATRESILHIEVMREPDRARWRRSERASSGCWARSGSRSGTGSRCASARRLWPRSSTSTRRRSTPTSSRRSRHSWPGWRTTTSRSWATASTTWSKRRASQDCGRSRTRAWGSSAALRPRRTRSWGRRRWSWRRRRIRWC